ncbi:PE domain-containing protein, partial [Mycobacterium avium]|uniref:PE domain-containing protein n=1 Tax=Mycobacterium avium TaxID=1764 RepID=UPI0012DAC610
MESRASAVRRVAARRRGRVVVPPAVGPVSLQTAAGFSAAGGEHAAVVAQG